MKKIRTKFLALIILLLCSVCMFGTGKGVTRQVTLTCYQPVEGQCGPSPLITAEGDKIDLKKLKAGQIKWCAVSYDILRLFPKGKPKRIYIEGYGVYEVKDRMHRRHTNRVDILVHPSDDATLYVKKIKAIILH